LIQTNSKGHRIPATGTGIRQAVPDEDVVRAVLKGDTNRFEELVRRHQRPIINFLYRMVGNFDLALDLSQDVFVRVYASLNRFDSRYRFTTWLYRIASNCAIDHLRRRRPATTSLDAPQRLEDGEVSYQPVSNEADPARQFEARERLSRLERAIDGLPGEYRKLVLLRHSAHLSYEDMAKATRSPLGTVKNRLFRAREMLRAQLDQEES
jgi:RNA polymerase sigma-70 factor (ECF subfamily)